jgi:outer membrane protein TolC
MSIAGWSLLFYIVFFLQCSFAAVQDWPEEARQYLNQLPEKKLTLDYVVARALSDADIFQLHKAEYLKGEALYMNSVSAEDFKVKGSYFYIDNENEPLVPQFMSTSTKGWEAKLGFEQYLSTGTALSVEALNTPKKLGFQSIPDLEFTETRLTVGLDQSLLGDFFGTAYRNLKRSAKNSRTALELGALSKIETSVLDTINLYYQAWLKQQTLKNLNESLKRRQRLNSIFKSQSRQGIVETSDALQVEGAALNNEADSDTNKQDLQSLWEQLVLQLKLPRSFLEVPADEIPIQLDSPESDALKYCTQLSFKDIENNSTQIRQAEKAVDAAQAKYAALKQKLMPDVRLQANYIANGIDGRARETWKEVGDLDNPALTAGVTVSFPLQNRQQKSQVLTAKIDLEQAQTNKNILINNMEVKWRLLCSSLKQKITNRNRYKRISETNKKRVSLDNRRFEVGRIKAFQWVQTEDDEATSTLRFQQAEVEVRSLAWDVQKQTGHLLDRAQAVLKVNYE